MSPEHVVLLVAAGFVGGSLNAVAGGGSFFTFPALLFTGIGPIQANATSNMALWPGFIGSVIAYRAHLPPRRTLLILGATSLVGSALGAYLLTVTPPQLFARMVPWLLLAATLIFTFSGRLTRLKAKASSVGAALGALSAVQGVLAIYGGYFGGGIGLMMLAAFSLFPVGDIHQMNALKTIMAGLINGVAVVVFVLARVIVWPAALVALAGAVLGGYVGAAVARKFDPGAVRKFVVATGWVLTAYFFATS